MSHDMTGSAEVQVMQAAFCQRVEVLKMAACLTTLAYESLMPKKSFFVTVT